MIGTNFIAWIETYKPTYNWKFKTNLYSHARGRHGCPKCNKHPNRLSTEDWLKRIKKVHGNKYDISKVKNIWEFVW